MLWRYFAVRKLGIALTETFALMCCGLTGYLPYYTELSSYRAEEIFFIVLKALIIAVIFQFCLHLFNTYQFRELQFSLKFAGALLRAVFFAILSSAAVFAVAPGLHLNRDILLWNLIQASIFVFLWHTGIRFYLRLRVPPISMLMLGVSNITTAVFKEILDHPELGIEVVGFIDNNFRNGDASDVNINILGDYDDLSSVTWEYAVNHVIVGPLDRRKKLPVEKLLDLKTKGVLIESVEAFYERITGKIMVENLRPSWLIFNGGFDVSKSFLIQKRIISILISIILLILSLPILLLTAIIIKLDSKGPVFYKQKRVGINNREFDIVKFRSMRQDAEKDTGPVFSTPGSDRRVTRVGRFLRRTRIDELPQLYNVLRGDMDIVGPRPERRVFVERFSEEISYYSLRHVVKPGITGWAQVNYGYAGKLEQSIEKLQYDLFYIKNMSITLDLVVMFETLKTVLVRKGS